MDWSKLERAHIRTVATARSYTRGEEVFARGAVRDLRFTGRVYTASVSGSRPAPYRVRIHGGPDELEAACTCPYEDGGACKHIVAVLLAIVEEGGAQAKGRRELPPEVRQRLEALLKDLSAERLREFVRLQASELEGLVENLEIFAQGTAETDRSLEQYVAEISAALDAIGLQADNGAPVSVPREEDVGEDEDWDGEEDEDWDGEEDEDWDDEEGEDWDEDEDEEGEDLEALDEALEPYSGRARKYLAQGNWREAAKIEEALVQACARRARASFGCAREAGEALKRLASAVNAAQPAKDKRRALGRLVALFAEGLAGPDAGDWEEALDTAAPDRPEAQAVLEGLKRAQIERLQGDPTHSGALLQVLQRAGRDEEYVEAGRKAVHRRPDLAVPVAERLVELGRRRDAIEVLDSALERLPVPLWKGFHDERRQAVQRALLRLYDPREDHERFVDRAKDVLFEGGGVEDYVRVRDALRTPKQRESLLRELSAESDDAALVLEILSLEERWDLLLEAARRFDDAEPFPEMLRRLGERLPRESFELGREVVLKQAEHAWDERGYARVRAGLQELRAIPGQEEAFWDLVAELTQKQRRRSGLMRALGDWARESGERQARKRQALFEASDPDELRRMSLEEMMALCPIGEADRAVLWQKGVSRSLNTGRRVWAILAKHGGTMAAADIAKALVASGVKRLDSAKALCSAGLGILEALGRAEVDRTGGRLGMVRLLEGPGPAEEPSGQERPSSRRGRGGRLKRLF
jgi:SWIM zinc finger